MAQYRYSVPQFRRTVAVALALTAMIAGLVWMLTAAADRPDAAFWAAVAALVFFAFVSATMLWRFLRNEVVLAIRPTGLYDARKGSRTIPWEDIRDIVLLRHENEYALEIFLWRHQEDTGEPASADLVIDLEGLESDPGKIVRDISLYKRIVAGPGWGPHTDLRGAQ